MAKVALECVAEEIERYTSVPAGLDVKPSGSSLIAMGYKNGLIVDDHGQDYRCMLGKPVSFALSGGVCQCPDDCLFCKSGDCVPSDGEILLEGGFRYLFGHADEEELMSHLKKMDKTR